MNNKDMEFLDFLLFFVLADLSEEWFEYSFYLILAKFTVSTLDVILMAILDELIRNHYL
jgi:hypothetical protein